MHPVHRCHQTVMGARPDTARVVSALTLTTAVTPAVYVVGAPIQGLHILSIRLGSHKQAIVAGEV